MQLLFLLPSWFSGRKANYLKGMESSTCYWRCTRFSLNHDWLSEEGYRPSLPSFSFFGMSRWLCQENLGLKRTWVHEFQGKWRRSSCSSTWPLITTDEKQTISYSSHFWPWDQKSTVNFPTPPKFRSCLLAESNITNKYQHTTYGWQLDGNCLDLIRLPTNESSTPHSLQGIPISI